MQTVNSNLFVGGPKDGQIIPIEDRLGIVEFPHKRNPDGRSWSEIIAYKRMAFRVGDAEISYWHWIGLDSSKVNVSLRFEVAEIEAEIEAET